MINNLQVTPSDGALALTWDDSAETDTDHITVMWRSDPALPWQMQKLPPTANSYVITGLLDGATYEVEVDEVNSLTGSGAPTAPTPPPPPPPLWNGDFSNLVGKILKPTANIRFSQYQWQQGAFNQDNGQYPYPAMKLWPANQLPRVPDPATGNLVQIAPPPAGTPFVLEMVSNDSDAVNLAEVAPYNVPVHAGYPAAALTSPAMFGGNTTLNDVFVGFRILFDPLFPKQQPPYMVGNDFFQFFELFGKPFGSPNLYLGVEGPGLGAQPRSTTQVMYMDVAQTPGYYPWMMPLVRNTWFKFVLRIVGSTDPTIGAVQMWVNDQPVIFKAPAPASVTGVNTDTLHYATLKDYTYPQSFYLNNYRQKGWTQDGTARTWTTGMKVGTTYASVN